MCEGTAAVGGSYKYEFNITYIDVVKGTYPLLSYTQ